MSLGSLSGDDEEEVNLDALTGFDFENLFGRILERLGIGKVERTLYTQDEGRDILVSSPQGLIIVECKHQPNTSIGRPILQKLHSAVISSKAVRGMLVTTGRFTEEAIAHAKKLAAQGTTVEMIDKPILVDMASKARIRLRSKGEALNIWSYSIPDKPQTEGTVGTFLETQISTSPRRPIDLLRASNRSLTYISVFAVRYSVDAIFQTSVGMIHREHAAGRSIMLDGHSGHVVNNSVVSFFEKEPRTRFTGIHLDFRGELPSFKVDSMTLQGKAKAAIAQLHTRTVSYPGKNNVQYSKTCEPGERDIQVEDIKQLYMPVASLDFRLEGVPYHLDCVQGPSGRLLPLSHDILKCRLCNLSIRQGGLLCGVCGRVTHSGGLRLASIHGFRCGACGRTTCRFDGHWTRRFFVWRRLLCPSCAEEAHLQGKATRELNPI